MVYHIPGFSCDMIAAHNHFWQSSSASHSICICKFNMICHKHSNNFSSIGYVILAFGWSLPVGRLKTF